MEIRNHKSNARSQAGLGCQEINLKQQETQGSLSSAGQRQIVQAASYFCCWPIGPIKPISYSGTLPIRPQGWSLTLGFGFLGPT